MALFETNWTCMWWIIIFFCILNIIYFFYLFFQTSNTGMWGGHKHLPLTGVCLCVCDSQQPSRSTITEVSKGCGPIYPRQQIQKQDQQLGYFSKWAKQDAWLHSFTKNKQVSFQFYLIFTNYIQHIFFRRAMFYFSLEINQAHFNLRF